MITALVLAAGTSSRMGQPKMALPWGNTTVLGQVIHVLQASGIDDILVVSGAARELVEPICRAAGARVVFNPLYAEGEMLASLQTGIKAMSAATEAALVTLGDQPQIQETCVRLVAQSYADSKACLIVPSYRKRRGHPWLVRRGLWQEITDLRAPETAREFLNRHSAEISYLELDSAAILQDLDTSEEYLKSRP